MIIIPTPGKELDELYAEIFLPNVSIITAPAKGIEELYAPFLTKFMSIAASSSPLPKKIYAEFHIERVVTCLLSSLSKTCIYFYTRCVVHV